MEAMEVVLPEKVSTTEALFSHRSSQLAVKIIKQNVSDTRQT